MSTEVLLRKLEQAIEVGDEVAAPRTVRQLLDRGTVPVGITDALSRAMGGNGGFILSTGCEVLPETPRANMAALMRGGQR